MVLPKMIGWQIFSASQGITHQLLGSWGFPGCSVVMNLPTNVGDTKDMGYIPGLGRSPGGGNSNTLQHSCLEFSIDRGARQATVHGGHKETDTNQQLSTQALGSCRKKCLYDGDIRSNHMTWWSKLVALRVEWDITCLLMWWGMKYRVSFVRIFGK